ncbi:MarR family winged helix-turn-helix transcriptional regulator [Chachezhania sediminis]|uniref:MarR family winged helix-turn-helix transcriptional regulator n=1 Tax=Chachezhania sediminis TaxID=2599291 RepID=UPI00131D2778|nr:MarR family transcriptional regulator [Chachezhania sediminis]
MSDAGDSRRQDERRFWLYVLDVHAEIYGRLNRAMKAETDISVTKFDALAQLYRYPDGLTMSALSEALRVTNGNVSGLVARLEKDGLAERTMSEQDRRSFTARLTPEGRERFERALAVHDRVLSHCLDPLTEPDLAEALGSLRRLNAGLKITG